MELSCHFLKAYDIDQIHFNLIRAAFQKGHIYVIDRGSYEGHKRLEFDHVTFQITHPGHRPLAPTLPQGVPPVTSDEDIANYCANYLMSSKVAENEVYCYSDDTEILMEDGWVLFNDLPRGAKVITLSLVSGKIVYQRPVEYFDRKYRGPMFHVHGRCIDQLVTPHHSLVVAPENSDDFVLMPIEDVSEYKWRRIRLKRDGVWKGVEREFFHLPSVRYGNYRYKGYGKRRKIPMDLWLQFMGIWLAEGSLRKKQYTAVITQRDTKRRKRILHEVRRIFPKAFSYDKDILVCDKQLVAYLEKFGHAADKFVPRELLRLSSRQLRILFDWMYLGDGNKKQNGVDCDPYRYSTKSSHLADDVQEICLKIGIGSAISYEKAARIYRVRMSTSEQYARPHIIPRKNIKEVHYEGRVYCVRVPKHHTLFVRRNGVAGWSGNTYGQYITQQIPALIDMYKRDGPGTNQATMAVGEPGSIFQKDPPCLRLIDTRMKNGRLHFIVYFRSWDLLAGLPENLGGLQLLKEYLAAEIGCEDGEIIASSKGIHLYDYQWPIGLARLAGVMPENSVITKEEAELGEGWMAKRGETK